ncbi:FtsX-like permease family protein [Actinosynnema sp. NPDC020468]|uniref:FtsX-like permease family protein n=1 Tax=Actinosynnema sp. NPDC020468 TaxID=3154488 RepID=UPI0034101278
MKSWTSDLLLGVRLALGGGRTSWARLALTAVGIGIGVALLLTASSVPTILSARDRHQAENQPITGENTPRALLETPWVTEYRGTPISGSFVEATSPTSPVPPGLTRLPGDGEIFLSPALAALLASPEGALLRDRFPQQVVGKITEPGLMAPNDLRFVAGDSSLDPSSATSVTGYGGQPDEIAQDPVLTLLIMVGMVALLFPVLVFVGVSTRLAAAQRDRRLSALRLVGAGAHRVRRIAAGESLLGALAGLATGTALFLVARRFVEHVELLGLSVFVGDLTPAVAPTVLLVVLVPVLAVATSLIAMRRTVIEPLGVVRQTKPTRRVLWWRVIPLILGVTALVTQDGALYGSFGTTAQVIVVAGLTLTLLSIPLLLPWLVERAVSRLNVGPPSWQLAIRRLQLESGTAARVVAGVAVVLAGAIALQSIMLSAQSRVAQSPGTAGDRSHLAVHLNNGTPDTAATLLGILDRTVGKDNLLTLRSTSIVVAKNQFHSLYTGTCDALRTLGELPSCQDGDAFQIPEQGGSPFPAAGTEVTVTTTPQSLEGTTWTIPRNTIVRHAEHNYSSGLLLTPQALGTLEIAPTSITVVVTVDPSNQDTAEQVRNATAPLTWRTHTSYEGDLPPTNQAKQFASIRKALLAGSLLTLVLASASLLVLALEQVRERRRPLAVLAATGVPKSTLATSLLLQNALPLLLALATGVAVGGETASLLVRITAEPPTLDWAGIAIMTTAAALLTLAVTALTLPSLNRATAATGLRAE